MPKQAKKATNLKVTGTNTTKNKTRRRTRKAGKEASTTDSRCEQLGKNDGDKLDRKQYNLLSGPYNQYWRIEPQNYRHRIARHNYRCGI